MICAVVRRSVPAAARATLCAATVASRSKCAEDGSVLRCSVTAMMRRRSFWRLWLEKVHGASGPKRRVACAAMWHSKLAPEVATAADPLAHRKRRSDRGTSPCGAALAHGKSAAKDAGSDDAFPGAQGDDGARDGGDGVVAGGAAFAVPGGARAGAGGVATPTGALGAGDGIRRLGDAWAAMRVRRSAATCCLARRTAAALSSRSCSACGDSRGGARASAAGPRRRGRGDVPHFRS